MNPETEQEPELLTVKETAGYLRIPIPTVYYLIQRGQLPSIQIGGRWRIKRSLLKRDILKDEGESRPVVLVADPDSAQQAFLKEALKQAGFGRIVVGTAQEAIKYSERQVFNAAIIAQELTSSPVSDLYGDLKEQHPGMPIVITTKTGQGEEFERFFSHGPVTLIKKPFEHDTLAMALRMTGHKPKETN